MTGFGLVLFVVVGVLMLTLLERVREPGCPLCRGKREHHRTCPRR